MNEDVQLDESCCNQRHMALIYQAYPRCTSPFAKIAKQIMPMAFILIFQADGYSTPGNRLHVDWRSWGGDAGGSRYSAISQINRSNVGNLTRAWTFHTGDTAARMNFSPNRIMPFETTPLVVDGTMYLSTPSGKIFAIDPETGREIWSFDSQRYQSHSFEFLFGFLLALILPRFLCRSLLQKAGVWGAVGQIFFLSVALFVFYLSAHRPRTAHVSRGVSYWQSEDGTDKRILFGNFTSRLFALNANTGKPRADFGSGGFVDLRAGVAERWPEVIYSVTSPPAIYRDLVIVGAEVPEDPSEGPSGAVRAFDVRSGKLVWTFETVPQTPDARDWQPGATQHRTGANVWSLMSVDTDRGIVFLPVGSASYDFYGADRKGANRFANSLVALDAKTGKVLWHFQAVHHDLWDYDLPAQPILAEVSGIPAVVQITKMGLVFILNRMSGEPLVPVQERPVPQSQVPGEVSWPTQPFPTKPPPLSGQMMDPADLRTDSQFCRDLFGVGKHFQLFTPYGLETTVQTPGEIGGGNWSGGSVDPITGRLFVNTNNLYSIGRMLEQAPGSAERYRRSGGNRESAFFWDREQTPCQKPPYGFLSAIDLNTAEIVWQSQLPTVNLGGTIVTAGGLLFLGATTDDRFRAFDSANGREIWSAPLEASAHATPITYLGPRSGRQFIVIAAGGGGIFRGKVADSVVAFSLDR